jgi:hypothetical protein
MFAKTVYYNGATLKIRREDVRSRLLRGMVFRHFDITEDMPDDEWQLLHGFVKFLTQVEITGDVGFAVPSVTADKKTVLGGYEAFLTAPGAFFDAYYPTLLEVDQVIGDPDTAPGDDGQKKVKPSSES